MNEPSRRRFGATGRRDEEDFRAGRQGDSKKNKTNNKGNNCEGSQESNAQEDFSGNKGTHGFCTPCPKSGRGNECGFVQTSLDRNNNVAALKSSLAPPQL